MRIGVLAVQGAFIEHERRLQELGADVFEIRERRNLEWPFDGLVLPGGESTVQGKLLRELGLFEPLRSLISGGLPVFGTCAGLILLARGIVNDKTVHFGLLDVEVERNAYGRQLGSFHAEAPFAGGDPIPLSFIRAPAVRSCGKGVECLATVDAVPVAVRQGNLLATSFHPEIDSDVTVHRYFLEQVCRPSVK